MRAVAFFTLFLVACSTASGEVEEGTGALMQRERDAGADAEDAAVLPSYAEVAPLLTGACRPCHWGSFDSLEKVKRNREAMRAMIADGRMPQGAPTWKDTADGQKVLTFLTSSPDLD
jgi:hypothetical protein